MLAIRYARQAHAAAYPCMSVVATHHELKFNLCAQLTLQVLTQTRFKTGLYLTNTLFMSKTHRHFTEVGYIYLVGHVIPTLLQVTMYNDIHDENYRSTAVAWVFYVGAVVSCLT